MSTERDRSFAVGDVCQGSPKEAISAVGDGVVAIETAWKTYFDGH